MPGTAETPIPRIIFKNCLTPDGTYPSIKKMVSGKYTRHQILKRDQVYPDNMSAFTWILFHSSCEFPRTLPALQKDKPDGKYPQANQIR
jgi:hypothetical protein